MMCKRIFPMRMSGRGRLDGFTLAELLVTMTLFSLVMVVVTGLLMTQLQILQKAGKGSESRSLFWYHLEVLALQTVGLERTGEGVRLVTWDDRTYTILTNPVVLVEEKGMRWQYPFSGVALFDVVSNDGRVLLSCRLIGLGFDETKRIVLGWRGERP